MFSRDWSATVPVASSKRTTAKASGDACAPVLQARTLALQSLSRSRFHSPLIQLIGNLNVQPLVDFVNRKQPSTDKKERSHDQAGTDTKALERLRRRRLLRVISKKAGHNP